MLNPFFWKQQIYSRQECTRSTTNSWTEKNSNTKVTDIPEKPHKKPTSHLIPINRTCRCVDAASRREKNANRSYSRKKKLMLKCTELTATNAETSDKRIPQPQPQEAPQKRSSPSVTNTV